MVGTKHFDFTLTKNNLLSLRDQINSLDAGVNATILTTETGNFLSINAATTGRTTLQLVDDPQGAARTVLTTANQGSNAEFKLNGIRISRSSNIVNNIVSGLTFTILDKTSGNTAVDLTLATDRSQLQSAIQDFAAKYNAVADKVNAQVGPNAGLLSGDFLIREVQNDLRSFGNYQASGTVKSLADMGVNFDSTGNISLDTAKFSALSDSDINGAFQFFGSASTGFGALASKFKQLTDPVTGLIRIQQDGYDATDRRLQTQMSDLTDRINAMQKAVAARLQVADSLLAQLQSQQNQLTASITSVNFALYGKSTTA